MPLFFCSIPKLLLLSLLCAQAFGKPRPRDADFVCGVSKGVLCVKDAIKIIAAQAKNIANVTKEIENWVQQADDIQTLNEYVKDEMKFNRPNLPIAYYHEKFFQRNNIDKEYLLNMFLEAHDAMTFYHRSIHHLLSNEDAVAQRTTVLFNGIVENMQTKLICGYRSILHAFSRDWQSGNEVPTIKFFKRHGLAPSLVHDIHSVIISRYLYHWMELINNVIRDLESKYF